jgi:hypothetical protein
VLALLEHHLGGRAGLDRRDAAGQLGQALLQPPAVVGGVGVFDLRTDPVDPPRDLASGVARAVDDGGLVLGDHGLNTRASSDRSALSSFSPTFSEIT